MLKNISLYLDQLTEEDKKKLLTNHQAVIESLEIIANLIKNPILRIIVQSVIKLCDFVIDTISNK